VEAGLLAALFALGIAGGFVSGLVGLGGGIIMVPLLLYVPPALGLGILSMKVVAGITSVQSFCGAVFGAIGHNRHNRISKPLAIIMGTGIAGGALVGSVASSFLTSDFILMVFAVMALVAAIMMCVPTPQAEDRELSQLEFNKPLAGGIGVIVGVLSGIVGQGGAFLFIPAMMFILRIPTRITIGTALAIGIVSSTAVLLGRVGTNQVPYVMSAVVVLGVLIGAQIGSLVSQRTPRVMLRGILSVLIASAAAKIWYELLVQ
jgi:uncharacterized protein